MQQVELKVQETSARLDVVEAHANALNELGLLLSKLVAMKDN